DDVAVRPQESRTFRVRMREHSVVLSLVEQLYAAALDEDALPVALRSLADYVKARSVCWLSADLRTATILSSESVGWIRTRSAITQNTSGTRMCSCHRRSLAPPASS